MTSRAPSVECAFNSATMASMDIMVVDPAAVSSVAASDSATEMLACLGGPSPEVCSVAGLIVVLRFLAASSSCRGRFPESVSERFLLYRSIAGVVMFVPSMCRHIGFEERIILLGMLRFSCRRGAHFCGRMKRIVMTFDDFGPTGGWERGRVSGV